MLEATVIGEPHLDAGIIGIMRGVEGMRVFVYGAYELARAHSARLFCPLTADDPRALDVAWDALRGPLRAAMTAPCAPMVLSDVDGASAKMLRAMNRHSVVRFKDRLWQCVTLS